jgi:hypothetical protein
MGSAWWRAVPVARSMSQTENPGNRMPRRRASPGIRARNSSPAIMRAPQSSFIPSSRKGSSNYPCPNSWTVT